MSMGTLTFFPGVQRDMSPVCPYPQSRIYIFSTPLPWARAAGAKAIAAAATAANLRAFIHVLRKFDRNGFHRRPRGARSNDTSGRASVALGVMLVAYALLSMVSPRLSVPRRAEWWLAPLIGVVTGFIAIMTGVFVLPLVPYLQSLALEKDELIQALGLSLVVSAVALAIALAREGALPLAMLGASVAALAPAGLGVAIGQWCRQKVSAAMFVRIFAVGLLLIGLHLALRSLI